MYSGKRKNLVVSHLKHVMVVEIRYIIKFYPVNLEMSIHSSRGFESRSVRCRCTDTLLPTNTLSKYEI